MTDAHRLTPEDVAVLRRRVSRGWAGTVTLVVTLGLLIYAVVSADDSWVTGWFSVTSYLALGSGLSALGLAYIAPRTGAALGAGWGAYLAWSATLPQGHVVVAPGAVSILVCGAGAAILAAVCGYGLMFEHQSRQVVQSWATSMIDRPVPDLPPQTRASLTRPRWRRVILAVLLGAGALIATVASLADAAKTAGFRQQAQITSATIEYLDEYDESHVVIDGTDYTIGITGEDENAGFRLLVRYNQEAGWGEPVNSPYDPWGPLTVVGMTLPAALWLWHTEATRRRAARRLVDDTGIPVWALATWTSSGLRIDADDERTSPLLSVTPVPAEPTAALGWWRSRVLVMTSPSLDLVAVRGPDGMTWAAGATSLRVDPSTPPPTGGLPDGTGSEDSRTPSWSQQQRNERWQSARSEGRFSAWLLAVIGSARVALIPNPDLVTDALILGVPMIAVVGWLSWMGTPRLHLTDEGLRIRGVLLTRTIPWSRIDTVKSDRTGVIIHTRSTSGLGPAPHPLTVKTAARKPRLFAEDPTAAEAAKQIEDRRQREIPLERPLTLSPAGPLLVALLTAAMIATGLLLRG